MIREMEEKARNISFWKKLGKIKLGTKVKGTLTCKLSHAHEDNCYRWYPKDADHFVIEEKWKALLGAAPKELEITLAFPTLVQNFDIGRAVYQDSGARWCYSDDGETAYRWQKTGQKATVKGRNGEPDRQIDVYAYQPMPCQGRECPYAKQCPIRGVMSFMIPAAKEPGTFFMRVGAGTSQTQILAVLKGVENLVASRPQGLLGLRMKLRREKKTFLIPSTTGDGSRMPIEKYVPVLDIDFVNLLKADKDLLGPFMGQPLIAEVEPATAEELEEGEINPTPPKEAEANPAPVLK